jgi:hypothetical protein
MTIHGMYAVEMTEHDMAEIAGGTRQPNSLFTRISTALSKPAPRTTPKNSYTEIGQYLYDALMASGDAEALKAFTEDSLAAAIAEAGPLPVGVEVTEDEREHGIPIGHKGEVFFSYEGESGVDVVEFMRVARATGLIVMLLGQPGCGKTQLTHAAYRDGVYAYEWGESSDITDVKGGRVVGSKPGEFPWRDGPLIKAAIYGCVHLGDEIAQGDPRVVTETYYKPLTEGYIPINEYPAHPYAQKIFPPGGYDGYLSTAKERFDAAGTPEEEREFLTEEEWIESLDWGIIPKPGFYITFAGNRDVPGAVLSEALLSRSVLKPEYLTNYDAALRILGPDFADIVTVARVTEAKRQNGDLTWAPQMRDLIGYKKTALMPLKKGGGQRLALANLLNNCESAQDREVLEDVIARTMGVSNIKPFRL